MNIPRIARKSFIDGPFCFFLLSFSLTSKSTTGGVWLPHMHVHGLVAYGLKGVSEPQGLINNRRAKGLVVR